MVYFWFVVAAFFAWRVWVYRNTLQEASNAFDTLESDNKTLTEDAQLLREEAQRLTDQVHALRQEQHQTEARYKEAQHTVGILAKQWDGLQSKHEHTLSLLNQTKADLERHKALLSNAERATQDTWERMRSEYEERWQEADQRVEQAEMQAAQIIAAAQEKATQMAQDTAQTQQERDKLQLAFNALQRQLDELRASTQSLHRPGNTSPLLDAISKKLQEATQTPPETQRQTDSSIQTAPQEEALLPSHFSVTSPPAAGRAVRLLSIVPPSPPIVADKKRKVSVRKAQQPIGSLSIKNTE